jgi:hypothetical protein
MTEELEVSCNCRECTKLPDEVVTCDCGTCGG